MQKKSIPKTEKINGLALLLAFGVSLAVAIPLRSVQLFTNIEEHTGFFKQENWTVGVMYAVLAVAAAALLLLPSFSAKIPASRPVVRKNLPMGVASLLFAAGLAYDVLFGILKIFRLFETMTFADAQSLYAVLFTNGLLAMLLQAVCGVGACVFMVLFALSFLGRAAVYTRYKLLAIAPLFWAMFRMILRFMTKISFTVVSELLIELAMLAFMMLFFMSFARICAQVTQKGEMRNVVRYGLPAAFFALLIGITRWICTISGRAQSLTDGFPFSPVEIGFGLFAATYIFVHMRYGLPASEDDAPTVDAGSIEDADMSAGE